ncbi:triose-phosphate isomerase [Rickettsiales endosymbiont of Peranema trichophorum]|uniref:triose-phosphate isomerase n=1 Tax=Rickettsiales endosymbiont of Peranema trichophorum TaxID=2486577 RepID=UPI001022BA6D|nr:triose-phosphate isomerase [Rickettsiales endosymbiont of Peranema trichophorum]RZI47784.1 triose-phosphate isomerase [Rickettsiales endosymbiont of Peranema trichophorum]
MRKLLVANWKMSSGLSVLEKLADEIVGISLRKNVRSVICPSFPYLHAINQVIEGSSVFLGAQDCSMHNAPSHTGDVSAAMLRESGCKYVILGHSERKRSYNETSGHIASKLRMVLDEGLHPIVCVGESMEDRKEGKTLSVIMEQISEAAIQGVRKMTVAYEPVWSIGTGVIPTVDDVEEVVKHIEHLVGGDVSVLYGGSVNAHNCHELMKCNRIGGFLVGKASLNFESFKEIYASLALAM